MSSVFLSLGSNLGDRFENLIKARYLISRQVGEIITISSLYKTAAWGNTNQPEFYNQVIEIDQLVNFNPRTMLFKLLEIEKKIGRVREERWGSRLIDIDMLFWNNDIIQEPDLIVPHPNLQDRRFVLTPLAEIAPDFVHPVLQKTSAQLLAACTDTLSVTKLEL